MYPTDEIYEKIFNFTSSDSPIEQLEDLGYEGANYMLLTGSLLINLILIILVAFKQYTCLFCAKKLYRYERMRNYGIKYQRSNNFETLMDVFLSGYLETFICLMLTFDQIKK